MFKTTAATVSLICVLGCIARATGAAPGTHATTAEELERTCGDIGKCAVTSNERGQGSADTYLEKAGSYKYGQVVDSFNACMEACRFDPTCQQAVYDETNKKCYPMSKMGDECPKPDEGYPDTCYNNDEETVGWAHGDQIGFVHGGTPAKCKDECRKTKKCIAAAWPQIGGTGCYLYSKVTATNTDARWRTWRCSDWTTARCVKRDIRGDVGNVRPYNYDERGHGSVEARMKEVRTLGVDDNGNLQYKYFAYGQEVGSVDACMEACQFDPTCQQAVYDETNKKCYPMSKMGDECPKPDEGYPDTCYNNDEETVGWAHGDQIGFVHGGTPAKCKDECRKTKKCIAAAWPQIGQGK
eukprot:g1648.t1